MAQKTIEELSAEYEHAVKQAKELAAEYEESAPEHLKERIRKAIRYAADLLIMMETPRHKIAGKLLEDFDYFYSRATVYRILGAEFFEEDKNNNSSQMRQNNSSLYSAECEQENMPELEIADRAQTFINLWKSVLHSTHWGRMRDPKERQQSNALMNAILGMAIQSLDGRRLVPTATQATLVECAFTYMPQDAYTHYLDKVKDVAKKMTAQFKIRGIRTIEQITGKRLTAILTLNVKEVDESLDPASPLEARLKGFSMQRCPKCKENSCKKCRGFRCHRVPDATEGRWYACECCDHKFEGIIIPPYVSSGGTIIEKKINETLDNYKKWKKENGIKD